MLQPFSFEEFLLANNEEALITFIRHDGLSEIPKAITEKLTDYLKLYFVVGGMPSAVNSWLDTRDYSAVEARQRDILETYENDFSKHALKNIVPKLRYLWNSVPSQLAKENKKFIYGLVREGARARDYEDLKAFKLYHLDVGLLRYMSELSPAAILDGIKIFEEFRGALTEQFVLTELAGKSFIRNIYYWTSDATAEVDFVFADDKRVYPVEVKAGENLQARSLRVYRERYNPE